MPQPHAAEFSRQIVENYQRYFVPAIAAPVADDLVRTADLRPTDRVLDVACGTGVVARRAADEVGARGTVVGVDVSPDMIAVARDMTPKDRPIDWQRADAADLPLPEASFDVVLCQLSLQLMSDRLEALREMRRVLADDGRLVLNVPGDESPVFAALEDALGRHVSADAAGFVHHVFSMADPEAVADLARQAGFAEVTAEVHDVDLKLPEPRELLWNYVRSTPLAGPVSRISDQARSALERDVVSALEPLQTDGRLPGRQPIVTVTASKAPQ